MPLVSIVIPTYNRAYCLCRAVDSALSQTHANVEVLIVDDGSTDDTRELVERVYNAEPRVRYIFQPNGGVSKARNTGLLAARGEFVALLDSDDLWFPWKLESQLAVMRKFPDVGMVWTDMEAVDEQGRLFHPRYLREMYDAYRWFEPCDLFSDSCPLSECHGAVDSANPELPANARVFVGDIFSQMVMGNLVHTSTVLLRRERREQVGTFREDFKSGEDYDFHLRTCREGKVAFLDASSIEYQRGMADRLTRPELSPVIARNFLSTLQRTLKEDADRIRLPNRMIRAVMSEAHCWVGASELRSGRRWVAIPHLVRSISWMPNHVTPLRLLIKSMLPRAVSSALGRVYRGLRNVMLKPHSSSPSGLEGTGRVAVTQ